MSWDVTSDGTEVLPWREVASRSSDSMWEAAPGVNVVYDTAEFREMDLESSKGMRELAYRLSSLVGQRRAVAGFSSLFDRGIYAPPDHIYSEMVTARIAVANDDILASAAEITEAMAFENVTLECPEEETTNILRQWAEQVDLPSRIKEMWKELFSYSQYIAAAYWGEQSIKLTGRTKDGTRRKKTFHFTAPTAIEILDSTKIVPIPSAEPGVELLCWHSTFSELSMWMYDPRMRRLILGPLVINDPLERLRLAEMGVSPDNLLLLDPSMVWRGTLTRPQYQPYAPVRLKSVFRVLDMKQQLMDADRATLVGAANYILLVRKGDKDKPGTPAEIGALRANFSYAGKVPVVVADHRLSIDIITPKTDHTLAKDRYEVLDQRLVLRSLNTFNLGANSSRSETSLTQGRLIAKGMENRRNEISRDIKARLLSQIIERNPGIFPGDEVATLTYVPKQITVDIDQVVAQAVQNARNTNDLSRRSYLEHFGFDEELEAMRVRQERDSGLDDLFQTRVPFNSPDNIKVSRGSTGVPDPTSSDPKKPGDDLGGRPKAGSVEKVKTGVDE